MALAIEVSNLRKSFGSKEVLKGVNFSVSKGSILALLGPNGAGKTTTINILSTLMRQDSGSAKVAGHDTLKHGDQVRANIGLTGQFAAVDEYLTGRENVQLIGQLYHLPDDVINKKTDTLIKKFDLEAASGKPARTYSGGMKRRLDLAMSLVADPQILFLDEPTTGLDPRSRLMLWQMIRKLADEGRTILLTTQYMEEADYLADNIVVIDHGIVIAEGTSSQLKAKAGSDKIELTFVNKSDRDKAVKILNANHDDSSMTLEIDAKKGIDSLSETLDKLKQARVKPISAAYRLPTLDDVFLALTGHGTEDEAEKESAK